MADEEQGSRRDVKADAKAEKARSKALRPWYKKKRFIIPLGLIVLAVLSSALTGGDDDDSTDVAADVTTTVADDGAAAPAETTTTEATGETTTTGAPTTTTEAPTTTTTEARDPEDTKRNDLYPDRPDKQDDDHEAEVGQAVRLSGYTTTVTGVEPYNFVGNDQLLVQVTVENRDDKAQPFNVFDWSILTADGQVLNPTFNDRNDALSTGDLVQGGTVSGVVPFDQGAGSYYVIYKPDPFDEARGIWQITI